MFTDLLFTNYNMPYVCTTDSASQRKTTMQADIFSVSKMWRASDKIRQRDRQNIICDIDPCLMVFTVGLRFGQGLENHKVLISASSWS